MDIVLRALICVIAVVILGVGIWTGLDSLTGTTAENKPAAEERGQVSDTNPTVHVSHSTR